MLDRILPPLLIIIFTRLARCVKHVTGVFTIFNHLTNIGVVHDIVIVRWIQYNLFVIHACYLFGFELFDTLSKSLDFSVKILFSPIIKFVRHLNENTGGEWVFHVFLKNTNIVTNLGAIYLTASFYPCLPPIGHHLVTRPKLACSGLPVIASKDRGTKFPQLPLPLPTKHLKPGHLCLR